MLPPYFISGTPEKICKPQKAYVAILSIRNSCVNILA